VVLSFQSDAGKLLALNAAVSGADGQSLGIFGGEDLCCDIIRDYGSGPNGNPRIDPFIVPESGTYYVVLWFDLYSEENATLDYEVSLSASTLISLSLGAEINDIITPESGVKSYAYNAQAGETLRITLTQTGGEGYPFIRVYSPETQILLKATVSPASVLSLSSRWKECIVLRLATEAASQMLWSIRCAWDKRFLAIGGWLIAENRKYCRCSPGNHHIWGKAIGKS
jgi:hypothetical protein